VAPSDGLDDAGTEAARQVFGPNLIAEQPAGTIAKLVRETVADPMIWFLLATSGIFGLTGQYTDMVILLVAILPLFGMDFYLHRRTQASIEGLRSVLATSANVLRNGRKLRVPSQDIFPGDLVFVAPGETFPADGVIVSGDLLQAEESSLTGEAYPVLKKPNGASTTPAETSWAFAGTRLLTGNAAVRVIFTGTDTIFAEIVDSVISGPTGPTHLQNEVARLVKALLFIATAFCILLAGVRLWQGFGVADAFMSAATLAVAAIPEEFPVVLTLFLGVGVYRLGRAGVLVRRAVAVENIGRVTVICSDKTGTITEGVLAFRESMPAEGLSESRLLELAGFASRADSGDPLDAAILTQMSPVAGEWTRSQTFPFTEGRKRETSMWHHPDGTILVATKGAPETILAICNLSASERDKWVQAIRELSSQGQKVIACAWQELGSDSQQEPDSNYRIAGLIGINDPVRVGVKAAITEAQGAGIQVVMVTGDHADTAKAIAKEAGIPDDKLTILGDDLEARLLEMTEVELKTLGVVARATPAQKVLLIEAFKRLGEIVAVTGDGVNDAPALRSADIGIAMGLHGTRSAREVSAMVLMDDNFRTIVSAINEGRQLFRNLRMSFAFLLMVHLPLVSTAALIPFLGFPLLYLPIHIVWLELLIHPAAILGFQHAANIGSLKNLEDNRGSLFSRRDWIVILATGSAISAVVLAIYVHSLNAGEVVGQARSMAMVTLISSFAFLIPTVARSLSAKVVTLAAMAIASTLLVAGIDQIAAMFHLDPLSWREWLFAACIGGIPAFGAHFLHAQAHAIEGH